MRYCRACWPLTRCVTRLSAVEPMTNLSDYENSWRDSDIGRDLYKVRNVKPLWSRFGLVLGVALGGFDMWTNELFKSVDFWRPQAQQAGQRYAKANIRGYSDRLPEAGWSRNL